MQHAKIKETIEELLKRMNMKFETVEKVESEGGSHVRFLVRSEDSAMLIGAKGENLGALNYIVRRIVAKDDTNETPIKFFVDVNGYHEKTLEALQAKAKIMSERARSFKVDIEMDPMSSYERMLVHSFLEGAADIKTESKGEGASRRVVIKYVSSSI
jgi:spoIIIJ-associated protein